MPDFRVIEGGGQGRPSFDDLKAKEYLRKALGEILRALARGEDHGKVLQALNGFIEHAQRAPTPAGRMINEVISEMHGQIVGDDDRETRMNAVRELTIDALRMAAELCSNHGFTRARVSKQSDVMEQSITTYLINAETLSRENNWSWIGDWLRRHFGGPFRPVHKTRKQLKDEQKQACSRAKELLQRLNTD